MRTRHIISIISAAILLSGCVKESVMDAGQSGLGLIPISINGTIVQKTTKATAEGFVNGDAVGLFAVNYLENNTVAGNLLSEGNQADNVKYVFDEDKYKWTPVKSVYYKDVNTHADIYLYYPYQSSFSDVNAEGFEVKKDQSSSATLASLSGYEASDFLWGKATDVTPSQTSTKVQLRHRMSAVKLILEEGDGFAEAEFVGLEKNVILTGTTRKANIDYATGEVVPVGAAQSDGIVMCPQSDGSWRAIAVPQTVAGGVQLFAITVNGVSYSFKMSSATAYQSGKQTEFTITVKKKQPSGEYEFTLSGTQITDWTEDENTHGGEARQYFVVTVENPGTLGATIKSMGKNPDKIRNLKIAGTVRDEDFYFMRDSMAILEAVNMKESTVAASERKSVITGASINETVRFTYLRKILGEPDYINAYDKHSYWYDKGNSIPSDAFKNKKTLSHFDFPEEIVMIGENAFESSTLSGALIIPDKVFAVFDNAFCDTNIESVSLSFNLSYFGFCVFSNCRSLSGILTLPSQVLYIGDEAFAACAFTGELHLPDKLEYLGGSAFSNAGHFDGNLTIPEKITELHGGTFRNDCFTGALDLNNVTSLDNYEFCGCTFSGELVIPEGISMIPGYCFYNERGGGFSSVQFPSTLRLIGENAFACQNHLAEKLILPEGVRIIKDNAFASCSISGIEFPSTVQSLAKCAFANCYDVSSIVCKAVEPPSVMSNTFNGIPKDNFTVEVPEQSIHRYLADSDWGEFGRIAAHYDFSVSRERIRLLNDEMTRTFTLRAPSNLSWSLVDKPDWVSVTPDSGTGKTDVNVTVHTMSRTSEVFDVNEGNYNNPDYKTYKGRSGKIVFKLDHKDYTFSMDMEQYDYDYADGGAIILQTATKGNGVDIVFIGEGYDAKDIASGLFLSNVEEAYGHFFNIEPYKTYKDYFNVYTVVSMSDDSGIGTANTIKETKFGTYFTPNRILTSLSPEPIFAWALKADDSLDITKSLVINLMNTSTYEGICWMYSDGSAIAFCPVSRSAYPNDFRGIIQHEAGGHGFGKLADEYYSHYANIRNCCCICCEHPADDYSGSFGIVKSIGWYKNVSLNSDMHQVPWAHLIHHPQYSDYVDMYEGGHYHSHGVYRSEIKSCMSNNIPYYSAISRQAIVERIMSIAGEEFTLEKFYAKDSNAFGEYKKTKTATTFGSDSNYSRHGEEHSVIYMGEHPDYEQIRKLKNKD